MKKINRRSYSGKNNPAWKGGRIYDKEGYVLLLMKDHPNCNPKGYIREHRIVVEKSIGRFLTRKENVHHINGKKDDNRIENLLLFSSNSLHKQYEEKTNYENKKGELYKWNNRLVVRGNE